MTLAAVVCHSPRFPWLAVRLYQPAPTACTAGGSPWLPITGLASGRRPRRRRLMYSLSGPRMQQFPPAVAARSLPMAAPVGRPQVRVAPVAGRNTPTTSSRKRTHLRICRWQQKCPPVLAKNYAGSSKIARGCRHPVIIVVKLITACSFFDCRL